MSRIFAVVPAAGLSRRMGRPKLLLDLGGRPVIERLLTSLHGTGLFADVVLVARRDDRELISAAESLGATVVAPPVDPPEMRDSIELGLGEIARRFTPRDDEGWALIPADHPFVTPPTLAAMARTWQASSAEILVPTYRGRGGHPTFFRWRLAGELAQIPRGSGLNQLLTAHADAMLRCEFDSPEITFDLDTPEDFRRAVELAAEIDREGG